ncbi:hypothetical protein [Bradyrhizobium sp. CCBAU 53421]|uniref:DUF6894 family protein n=1 Tax=Bradyrhizobium sp. CCBAU 53421 TaxID=1325120 RepID=UPI0035302391
MMKMERYYFDLRDGCGLAIDEEGLEMPNLAAVQEEAVRALARFDSRFRSRPRSRSGCNRNPGRQRAHP